MVGRFMKRRDMNQTQVVQYARGIGFSVLETHNLGGGLDLLVGLAGIDQRVEVKNPDQAPSDQQLTEGEEKVFATWRGRKPIVWKTLQDVMETRDAMLAETMKRIDQGGGAV